MTRMDQLYAENSGYFGYKAVHYGDYAEAVLRSYTAGVPAGLWNDRLFYQSNSGNGRLNSEATVQGQYSVSLP